jgi:high affinity Mn2+ porin
MTGHLKTAGIAAAFACAATNLKAAAVSHESVVHPVASPTNSVPLLENTNQIQQQNWNVHAQGTVIVQGYPGFSAQYSGPNSLPSGGQTRETITADLMAGVRLWHGAEAHVDGMMWQGTGVGGTFGVEAFPNGEANSEPTSVPNVNFVRAFIRQTIGFGGPTESVQDDDLHLAGTQDISRLTVTVGRFSALDIFDNNSYAASARTQFLNWGLGANEPWDFPQDALGFMTGMALELNQPLWTARYGFFQMPAEAGGSALDQHFLEAWGMVTELERRYSAGSRPGVLRLLAYLNHAHMGSYQEAINISPPGAADIAATRAYRFKYGFGLNWEQQIASNIGIFVRGGWSDGQTEAWCFTDVDHGASLGVSISGAGWGRPNDTVGMGGVFNGITKVHQEFFADGGTGLLAGDGNLNYGWEKSLETYYDFKIWKNFHGAVDYQFVTNPAFNRARGPVSLFAGRLHWEF